MARKHRFDNVPSPRLMQTIGATALKPPEAVAELVANSLDARVADAPVRVDVRLEDGQLAIADDASGMTLDILQEAVRLGIDMDIITGRKTARMGTYGLGMKTAAASLGRRWGIVTRPENQDGVEYRVTFDLDDYGRRGASASHDWSIEIVEDEPDASGPLVDRPHGTAIWVTSLRDKEIMAGAILDFLGRAYSPHITTQKDRIFVNGTEASPAPYNLIEGSRHEFDELVVEGQDWRVSGWFGLDSQTHNRGDYGINLYREGQLIESWNKSFFAAHLMTSRIMGEAHLDFVPVNFNKRGFETSREEWRLAVATMKALLRPAVEASRSMSRGRDDTSRVHRALSRMRSVLGNGAGGEDESGTDAPPASNASDEDPQRESVASSTATRLAARRNIISLPRGSVTVDCTVESLDNELLPWDYVYDASSLEMVVMLNANAVAFEKTSDEEFLGCLAIADCIARVLQEYEGIDSRRARRVRDEWLHDALTGEFRPVAGGVMEQGADDSHRGATA